MIGMKKRKLEREKQKKQENLRLESMAEIERKELVQKERRSMFFPVSSERKNF